MIKEDFVSYEVALLLKEKGFNESCNNYYPDSITKMLSYRNVKNQRNMFSKEACTAPILQEAMRWLRKKGIVVIPILSSVRDNEKFLWDIEITIAKTNESYHQGWIYESYERACDVAIKYCLENLI